MVYKAVINSEYLCHYNKNHSKANGQFVSGDGDGDGIANDHAHRSSNERPRKQGISKKAKVAMGVAAGVGAAAGAAAIIISKVAKRKKSELAGLPAPKGQLFIEANADFRMIPDEYDYARLKNAKFVGGDW